jgi:hypothetical protein
MLLASTFVDALFRADFVTALQCPLGAAALLTLFLGVTGLIFFARESTKAKFVVFFKLGRVLKPFGRMGVVSLPD